VLEREEHEAEADGSKLAPALPLTASGTAGMLHWDGESEGEGRV
jgi:hypothetical protein